MTGGLDRLGIATCCAPPVIISVDFAVVSVLVPAMRADLGLGAAETAWMLSGYSLGYGALLIAAGRWADVHGRRRALLEGLVVFAVSAAVVSVATTAATAVAARIVQGAGAAMMLPAGLSLLTAAGESRAAAYGLALAVGFVAGTLAGGLLAVLGSWRVGMAITVPCCLAAIGGAVRLRDTAGTDRRSVGAGAAIGVGSLVAAGGAASGLTGPPGIVLPLAAMAVLLGFAARLGQATTGQRRPLTIACAASAVITGTGVAALLVLTLFLQDARGYTPLETGLLFACFGVAAVPGAAVARRRCARPLVSLGLALQGAALLTAVTAADTVLVACLAGFGFGHVVANAATVILATASAPSSVHGTLTGTLGTAQRLGGAAGPLLAARFAGEGEWFAPAMAVTGATAVVAAGFAWMALRDVAA